VATTRALDLLRQRIRQRTQIDGTAEFSEPISTAPGPLQDLHYGELSERLRRALALLPADQAEVFCLRALEEQSYRQIARQMKMTTNAAGVLLHRARLHLQEIMKPAFAEQQT
jgi:RNA polymerase sigma-70 factor (ECF subfamily)